jgi:hypothetical protein
MEKKMNSYPMKLITTNASAALFAKKKKLMQRLGYSTEEKNIKFR